MHTNLTEKSHLSRLFMWSVVAFGVVAITVLALVLQAAPAKAETTYKPLTPNTAWQWQLSGRINETILDSIPNPKKMYDIDMVETPASTISRLKAKGITVICYMEVGGWESYRPDAAAFPESVKGKTIGGYPDERYLDIRQTGVLMPIMTARFDMAVSKGCDGIEPDLDDTFLEGQTATGFPLTLEHQVTYNTLLADAAHARNLSFGQKNGADAGLVNAMINKVDWVLVEQCYQYKECDVFKPFVLQNKAVFGVEYKLTTAQFCSKANAANYDFLKKTASLGATPRTACRN